MILRRYGKSFLEKEERKGGYDSSEDRLAMYALGNF